MSRVGVALQEEEALLSEMDVTGQAFEDMQEQNLRLLQQLREKDDANFKLISPRVVSGSRLVASEALLTAILPQARLTCPCCNARKKDAVLTKCFHVFCFECVKSRYDTRQRKCPKCNAAFGAHDFHRVYIS
ncbi:hypothetical protein Q9233_017292 [Columba guinea]|nr:hypothetical protein Q9233_017292 [Columba guinea]